MPRARVKRGFCITAGRYAVVDEIVDDLPDWLYREMLARESIEPVADEQAAPQRESAAEPPVTTPATAGKKGK